MESILIKHVGNAMSKNKNYKVSRAVGLPMMRCERRIRRFTYSRSLYLGLVLILHESSANKNLAPSLTRVKVNIA